jgi:hypothetical protein
LGGSSLHASDRSRGIREGRRSFFFFWGGRRDVV